MRSIQNLSYDWPQTLSLFLMSYLGYDVLVFAGWIYNSIVMLGFYQIIKKLETIPK